MSADSIRGTLLMLVKKGDFMAEFMVNDLPRDERRLSDEQFFGALKPINARLKKIIANFKKGELESAKADLVDYFLNRKSIKWINEYRDREAAPGNHLYPQRRPDPVRRAKDLLRYKVHLYEEDDSRTMDIGPDFKWHTSEVVPLAPRGYILKRGHLFRDLTQAYLYTGQGKYAKAIAEYIDHWLEDWALVVEDDFDGQTPVMSLSQGHEAMNTATRVFAWMDAWYSGILHHKAVSVDIVYRLLRSMWFTGLQYRHYEKNMPYMNGNHHLYECGVAPYVFGTVFPEFKEFDRLKRTGIKVMVQHLRRSYRKDGSYEERSLAYSNFASTMFHMPIMLAQANGEALFQGKDRATLRRFHDLMATLVYPDGSLPDIGDGDIRKSGGMLAAGSNLFHSGPSRKCIEELGIHDTIRPQERERLNGVPAKALAKTVYYPDLGVFLSRDGWNNKSTCVSLCVPTGGDYNHAHDDANSLELMVKGVSFIATPASQLYTITYRKGTTLFGYMQSEYAHNLVLVEGKGVREGGWIEENNSRFLAPPVETSWKSGKDWAESTCIKKISKKVRHTRSLRFDHAKGIVLKDRVDGQFESAHIARFHFEYGVDLKEISNGIELKRDGVKVRMHFSGDLQEIKPYRDETCHPVNIFREKEKAPWVLDLSFGEGGGELETAISY